MNEIPEQDQAPKRRVKFGAKPTQNIPFEWAETILTAWAERDPQGFGRYLQFAALGEMPSNGRRARGSGAQ